MFTSLDLRYAFMGLRMDEESSALTDFLLIFPLKSKQAEHVTNILLHSVLQTFDVKRIHSDNGPW